MPLKSGMAGLAQVLTLAACEQVISEDLGLQLEKIELSSLGRAKKVNPWYARVVPGNHGPAAQWHMSGLVTPVKGMAAALLACLDQLLVLQPNGSSDAPSKSAWPDPSRCART